MARRPMQPYSNLDGKVAGQPELGEELEHSGLYGPALPGRFGGSAEETDHHTPKSHQCNVGKEEEPTEEWR